jgi:capsid assembly protease
MPNDLVLRLAGAVFAMAPAAADTLMRSALAGIEAYQRLPGGRRADDPRADDSLPMTITPEGVAVIRINGPLMARAGFFEREWLGMVGYEQIVTMAALAIRDRSVVAWVLDINSPGGLVGGCFEAAAELRALARIKPLYACVNDQCSSAAYVLACAADHIVAPRVSTTGSIGVYRVMIDATQQDQRTGLKWDFIASSPGKIDGNPHVGLSEQGRQHALESVLDAASVFVEWVAQRRGIGAEAVRQTDGKSFGATDAKALGLIDTIADLAGPPALQQAVTLAAGAAQTSTPTGDKSMADSSAVQPGAGAADEAVVRTRAQTAERERIAAILSAPEAEGRGAAAHKLAFETDLTPKAAQSILSSLPVAQQATADHRHDGLPADLVRAAMGQTENAPVVAGGGNASAQTLAERLRAARSKK